MSSGHSFVATALGANTTAAGRAMELLSGVSAFEAAKRHLALADSSSGFKSLLMHLEGVRRHVLAAVATCVINLTGDTVLLTRARTHSTEFLSSMSQLRHDSTIPLQTESSTAGDKLTDFQVPSPPPPRWPEESKMAAAEVDGNAHTSVIHGLVIPTKVNYVGAGGRVYDPGEVVPGSAAVAAKILRTGYLWEKVSKSIQLFFVDIETCGYVMMIVHSAQYHLHLRLHDSFCFRVL